PEKITLFVSVPLAKCHPLAFNVIDIILYLLEYSTHFMNAVPLDSMSTSLISFPISTETFPSNSDDELPSRFLRIRFWEKHSRQSAFIIFFEGSVTYNTTRNT